MEELRRGLATRNTLSCPKGIRSVTQSRINAYTQVEIGGVRSYLHADVLVCKLVFALLEHGAVSALCCDEPIPHDQESTEQYKQLNTVEGSCDSASCSQLVNVSI